MKEKTNIKQGPDRRPLYFFETLIITVALWFMLSGIFELKFILFGLTSCIIISLLCMNGLIVKGINTGKEYYLLHFNYIKFLGYFIWLTKEIINAAIYVSRLITGKYPDFKPGIVWFRADYDNPLARALLANSITITPGTVTVDIYEDGIYSVHAISDELREGVLDGGMQERIAKVFGETIHFEVIETEMADSYLEPHRFVGSKSGRKYRRTE